MSLRAEYDIRRSLSRWALVVLALTAGSLIPTSSAAAQGGAELTGIVTDTAGVPIFGAIVSLDSTSLAATTNDLGEFRIVGAVPGQVRVRARRLGFAPSVRDVKVSAQPSGNTVQLTLSALPTSIRPVVVTASRAEYAGRLAGYYQRLRRRSGGQFIDRRQIDENTSRSLSQLLARMPGVNAIEFRRGGSAVRMRGRSCRPLVWLDGVPMPAGEVDLEAFPTNTLHGIELYLGSTSAPFDYTASQGFSACGTILLWSRGKDTEAPRRSRSRPVDLERLAAAAAVYTADQVDEPARLLRPSPLAVTYPPSLYASRVEGAVVAEFVVGASGAIEDGTFAIVSSTDPLFSQAVTRALEGAAYSPARRKGAVVRQVIQQRFAFDASGDGRRASVR